MRRWQITAALPALVLGLAAADAARGEAKWIEAAGVARAEPGEGKGGPGRAAALRAALSEAVQMVAVELLTASETTPGKPPPDPAAISEKVAKALGGDPSVFIARYQIREDRGVQPRLLLADPEAKAEYQLVVMAQVDVAKVRQRVGARAAPAPEATEAAATPQPEAEKTPEGEFSTFDVEIEQITSYKEYAAVRDALLGKIGARRAQPVEFSRGRAVFNVESPVPAQDLGRALSRALDGQLGVEPVAGGVAAPGDGRLRLRVRAPAIAPKPLSN